MGPDRHGFFKASLAGANRCMNAVATITPLPKYWDEQLVRWIFCDVGKEVSYLGNKECPSRHTDIFMPCCEDRKPSPQERSDQDDENG